MLRTEAPPARRVIAALANLPVPALPVTAWHEQPYYSASSQRISAVRVIPDIAPLLTSADEESLVLRAKQYAAWCIEEIAVSGWFLQGTDSFAADSRLEPALSGLRQSLTAGVRLAVSVPAYCCTSCCKNVTADLLTMDVLPLKINGVFFIRISVSVGFSDHNHVLFHIMLLSEILSA